MDKALLISSALRSKENIVWEGKPDPAAYRFFCFLPKEYFLGFLIVLLPIELVTASENDHNYVYLGVGVGLCWYLVTVLYRSLNLKNLHYVITTDRVMIVSGVAEPKIDCFRLAELESVETRYPLLERYFGTRSLELYFGHMTTFQINGWLERITYKFHCVPDTDEALELLRRQVENNA